MTQSRIGSLVEALANIAIGLLVSIVANALVFPAFGFHPSAGENVSISLIYTGISLARQYVLRRWFNARLQRMAERVAKAVTP